MHRRKTNCEEDSVSDKLYWGTYAVHLLANAPKHIVDDKPASGTLPLPLSPPPPIIPRLYRSLRMLGGRIRAVSSQPVTLCGGTGAHTGAGAGAGAATGAGGGGGRGGDMDLTAITSALCRDIAAAEDGDDAVCDPSFICCTTQSMLDQYLARLVERHARAWKRVAAAMWGPTDVTAMSRAEFECARLAVERHDAVANEIMLTESVLQTVHHLIRWKPWDAQARN